jgi:large subunit ribosomal protein L2
MSVRKLKPVTPGQRFRVVNGFDAITTDKPEKSLLVPKKRSGGRNDSGRMTMRYIGGGHKKSMILTGLLLLHLLIIRMVRRGM